MSDKKGKQIPVNHNHNLVAAKDGDAPFELDPNLIPGETLAEETEDIMSRLVSDAALACNDQERELEF